MNRPSISGTIESTIRTGGEKQEVQRGVTAAFFTGMLGRFMRQHQDVFGERLTFKCQFHVKTAEPPTRG